MFLGPVAAGVEVAGAEVAGACGACVALGTPPPVGSAAAAPALAGYCELTNGSSAESRINSDDLYFGDRILFINDPLWVLWLFFLS